MKRQLAALTLALLVVTTSVACGDDGEEAGGGAGQPTTTAAATPGEPKPVELAVQASEYKFTAPGEVRAGLVTLNLNNTGRLKHEAALIKIGDTPPDQALTALASASPPRPIPPSVHFGGGVGRTPAGSNLSSTLQLQEGNYLIVCTLTDTDSQEGAPPVTDEPAHYTKGMSTPIKVTAGAGATPPPLPEKEGAVVAKEVSARQYSFDLPPLRPGRHEYVFRNEGPNQPHQAQFLEYPAGVDEAAAQQVFGALQQAIPTGNPPPPDVLPKLPSVVDGTGAVFDPGLGGTFSAELQAGRVYQIQCVIQDRSGGPPHISQGMVRFVTVR